MNTNRVVMAYCGDARALAAIANAVTQPGYEVVVLAGDLGGGPSLTELRDRALAAGAVRCHALDLRESYLRDTVLPALRAGVPPDRASFIQQQLAEIARLEGAIVLHAEADDDTAAPHFVPYPFDHPACVELAFRDGEPVSINGVAMTLTEIVESLETIARVPAIDVLRLAYDALSPADARVTLRVGKGDLSVMTPAVA